MQLERLLKGEIDSYSVEKQYVRKCGSIVWGRLTVSLVRDIYENPEYFISVIEDIDDKKRIETELFRLEALLSKIVSAFSERTLIWVASPDLSQLFYVNNGYAVIYGQDPRQMYHNPSVFIEHVHPDDRSRVSSVFSKHPLKSWDLEYRIVDALGAVKYIHDRGCLIYDTFEKRSLILGTADDITDEKSQENALRSAVTQLERLSKTDALTGLANRREFLSLLKEDIARVERGQSTSTLVYMDLNNFKEINDKHGHQIGDKVLQHFANTMSVLLRESDKFGRIGGDEFVILLYGTTKEETECFFERLDNTTFTIEGSKRELIPIQFSLGWREWDNEISSVHEWLDLADAAMYKNKRKCKDVALTSNTLQ